MVVLVATRLQGPLNRDQIRSAWHLRNRHPLRWLRTRKKFGVEVRETKVTADLAVVLTPDEFEQAKWTRTWLGVEEVARG